MAVIAFRRWAGYHPSMTEPTARSDINQPASDNASADDGSERIAKRMARAGLCSRREAEAWVLAGRVRLNGKLLDSPAVTVGRQDRIEVDGKPLPDAEPVRLWRYHKPAGLVTTNRDPEGRRTIFEALPPELPRVITIGRLDLNSEGLLLLTNDGETARRLELPGTAWQRKYRVRVHGTVDPAKLATLANGHEVSGVKYGPIMAELERQVGANAWLLVSLREGKNREVRKVMESIGLMVNRLIRIAYGPFQLGNLPSGAVEEVPARVLADQLGGNAKTAGDDTDKPKDTTGRAKAKPRPPSRPPAKARQATGARPDKPGKASAGHKSGQKPGAKQGAGHGKPPAGKRPDNKRPGGKHSAANRHQAGRPAQGNRPRGDKPRS